MSDVRIHVELAHPADVVWRALTERSLMSEWFMPTDLAPVVGGVFCAFPPAGLAGFAGRYDVEVLEVVEHQRIRMQWRGEELHTDVVWELSDSDPGVSLTITQSGFLGLSADHRRAELAETYESLFRLNLPEVLATIAAPLTRTEKVLKATGGAGGWRRLTQIPSSHRSGILAVLGAMVITGLICSAMAVLVLRPPSAPADITADGPSIGPFAQSGMQPGATATAPVPASVPASPSVSAPASSSEAVQRPGPPESASASPNPVAASAVYRTSERFPSGWIGSITIKAGSEPMGGWSAVVKLPNRATLMGAWDQVGYTQERRQVTFTPDPAHHDLAAGEQFTFYFQVGDPSEAEGPQSCAVNGLPCAGLRE